MNKYIIKFTSLALSAAVLTSCSVVESNPQAVKLLGGVAGAVVGHNLDKRGGSGGAILGALAGYALTSIVVDTYRANEMQKRLAAQRAVNYRTRYAKVATSKKVRYVAVPVPKRQGSKSVGKSDYMKADASTGKVVSDKVYEVNETGGNKIVKMGGSDTLLYSGFQGI